MTDYLAHLAQLSTTGLVNHLWQSSVFALAVWLLTLALRRSQARIRYVLWMLASVKFLLPFSLLVAVGELIRWRGAGYVTPTLFAPFVEDIANPFPAGDMARLQLRHKPVTHCPQSPLQAATTQIGWYSWLVFGHAEHC
jgi:hypothetical protein